FLTTSETGGRARSVRSGRPAAGCPPGYAWQSEGGAGGEWTSARSTPITDGGHLRSDPRVLQRPRKKPLRRSKMSTTFRAVEVPRPGVLNLVRRTLPEPAPGQVRLRVEACGVCHSDSATVEGQFPGLILPPVPGHEVVGRIDALGPVMGGEDWH